MDNNYMLIYVGGAVMIFFIFWRLIPFIKKVKKVSQGLFSKIYMNKKGTLNKEQYRKLVVGAIYSEQQTSFINSLTTGLSKAEIQEKLSDWWGINNSEEANESLNYLHTKGFRFYFETVLKAYNVTDEEEQKAIIISGFDELDDDYEEDIHKAYQQLKHLQETWSSLTTNNIISTKEELVKYNNIGWDCGRMTFLSRLCYDAGYISENDAWKYIEDAYKLTCENFNDWEGFSKSYIIGRGMWGGTESANEGIMSIAEYLLEEEKSPWVQMNLK